MVPIILHSSSPVWLLQSPDESWRRAADYCKLNPDRCYHFWLWYLCLEYVLGGHRFQEGVHVYCCEKRIRNSLYSHGINTRIYLKVCPRATFILLLSL